MGALRALIPAFLFVVLLTVFPATTFAVDVMELTSATTSPGSPVTLTVLLTHDGAVQGYQTAITYDSTILTLTDVNTTGLDVETEVDGAIEFFLTSTDPNVAPGLGWAASAAVFQLPRERRRLLCGRDLPRRDPRADPQTAADHETLGRQALARVPPATFAVARPVHRVQRENRISTCGEMYCKQNFTSISVASFLRISRTCRELRS